MLLLVLIFSNECDICDGSIRAIVMKNFSFCEKLKLVQTKFCNWLIYFISDILLFSSSIKKYLFLPLFPWQLEINNL